MRFAILVFSLLALAACATAPKPPAEVINRPYPVVVPGPCIAPTGRADKPITLKERYTDAEWASLPPRAKASAVQAQGGERLNYEDKEGAATSACK